MRSVYSPLAMPLQTGCERTEGRGTVIGEKVVTMSSVPVVVLLLDAGGEGATEVVVVEVVGGVVMYAVVSCGVDVVGGCVV